MPRVLLPVLVLALAGCGAGEVPQGGERTRTVTVETPGVGAPDVDEEQIAHAEERCPGAGAAPGSADASKVAEATLCLVNGEREREGLDPLRADRRLAGAARRKARDMVRRGYFAHTGPDGKDVTDWVRGTGYLPEQAGYRLGENIASAGSGLDSPAQVVAAWMDSPSHRRNILHPGFEHSGIGIATGVAGRDAGGTTYAHFFGARGRAG